MPKQEHPSRYELLAQVLPLLAEFEAINQPVAGPEALAAFVAWLPTRAVAAPAALVVPPPAPAYAHSRQVPNAFETPETLLGRLVAFMYRYVRSYARLALADTPLVTLDDFTYLVALFHGDSFSKSELIARNVQEKATGTEIIKRLLKQGLMGEGPHATDRRQKVLHLTANGRALLLRVLPRMGQVARLSAGNLEPAERQQLVHLLYKLDAFHNPIFHTPKPANFDQLAQLHLGG